ncbi:MAG: gas vesicle protein [Myxococcales bacterium]|nr:gas vesicle protein [Myxococcales bacterium]
MAHIVDLDQLPIERGQPVLPDRELLAQLDPDESLSEEERVSLCEVLDRVLHKGVVLRGDLVISVADVELLYLGLELVLCSTETARKNGLRLPRDMTEPPMRTKR